LQEIAFPENSLGIAQGTVTALLMFGGRQRVTSARSVTPVSCCLASFLVLLRCRFRLRILPLG